MFSISSFRNESGCFEQEKCPGVYLSSLRTKCTQDQLIFKVFFWRSKKLSDVVRRLTWSLTERERATCEDEWLNTSRISLISEPWLRSTSIDVILAYFSKGFKVERKYTVVITWRSLGCPVSRRSPSAGAAAASWSSSGRAYCATTIITSCW